jgi:hypothetical protein
MGTPIWCGGGWGLLATDPIGCCYKNTLYLRVKEGYILLLTKIEDNDGAQMHDRVLTIEAGKRTENTRNPRFYQDERDNGRPKIC